MTYYTNIEWYRNELHKAHTRIDELKCKSDARMEVIMNLENMVSSLQTKLYDARNDNQDLRRDLQKAADEVRQQNEVIRGLRQTLQTTQKNCQHLSDRSSTLKAGNTELQNRVEQRDKLIAWFRQSLAESQGKVEDLNQKLRTQESRAMKAEDSVLRWEKTSRKYAAERDEAQKRVEELETQQDQWCARRDDLLGALSSKECELRTAVAQIKEENARAQKAEARIHEEQERAKRAVAQVQEERERVEKAEACTAESEDKLSRLQQAYVTVTHDRDRKIKALHDVNRKYAAVVKGQTEDQARWDAERRELIQRAHIWQQRYYAAIS